MTLEQSLSWLDSTQQFGVKLGLENTRRLLDGLGRPQDQLRFLHVAGTNGKGSVCAILDAILRASHHRTGLYTSPHLIHFRERIRTDGAMIAPSEVREGLEKIRAFSEGWDHLPTFFEISTALALWHFARQACDIVVLETGMGGRLDATNAICPLVSVITPIARDHSEWLGESLAQIAAEKAGIIKQGVPVVSAPQATEAAEVLRKQAAAKKSPLRFVADKLDESSTKEIALQGTHQLRNAALAAAALEEAGIRVAREALHCGLRDVRWPGRFQVIKERIVLDGSHNPHAAAQLVITWRETFGPRKATIIFGALADKDYPSMLEILHPVAEEFLLVPISNHRAATQEMLTARCRGNFRLFDSARSALSATTGLTLVTGSLFLVGEAMTALGMDAP